MTTKTLSISELKKYFENGYAAIVYDDDDKKSDFIYRIEFTKQTDKGIIGFSYDCGSLKQKELRSLCLKINKIKNVAILN